MMSSVWEKRCLNWLGEAMTDNTLTNDKKQVYKGIFWITDLENIAENKLFFRIPVDPFGNIDPSVDRMSLNSKNLDNYNHKNVWEGLSSKDTQNKGFDYYPRGRVEISKGKATIYANSHICTEDIVEFVRDRFNLIEENGICKVRVVPDNSFHYECYMDK